MKKICILIFVLFLFHLYFATNVNAGTLTYSNNLTQNPGNYNSSISWFNATWNDTTCNSSGNRCWNVSLLETNYTGSLKNYTMSANGNTSYLNFVMPAGTFQWRIIANDSANAQNATPVLTYTIAKAFLSFALTGSSVTYPNAVNIVPTDINTADGDVNYTFWRNTTVNGGILISSAKGGSPLPDTTILGAATYTWIFNSTGGANWTGSSSIGTFTGNVSKANPSLVLSNNTASVNTSQLFGYWRFEEGSGTTAFDSSGNGNNGTLTNNPAWTTGIFGNAISLNGVNQNVSMTMNTQSSSTTYVMWANVNKNTTTNCQDVFSLRFSTGSLNDYLPYCWGINGSMTIFFYNATGSSVGQITTSSQFIGQWKQLAVIFNSTYATIYVNGQIDSTISFSQNLGPSYTLNSLYLGSNVVSYPLNGTIDEVQIWNRSLTASEINELYQSQVTYPTQTTFTGSNCPTIGATDVTCNFYKNTTPATSGSAQNLGAGFYYYVYNTSGGQNYTSSSILLPLNVAQGTLTLTIESPNKNSLGTIIARPNANVFTYGRLADSIGTAISSQLLTFNYTSGSLGTNTTASDGTYNFTFSIGYTGNYTYSVNYSASANYTSGSNSTVLYISNTPQNVKYRLSYHIGSTKTDDVENTGNFNETVDSLSVSRFFYSSNPNLAHAYTCTYDTNTYPAQLVSLIHSYQRNNLNYINFTASSTLTDYILELSQKIAGSSLILAYAQGDCNKINNDMYLVESNQIPSHAFSSFSFGIPKEIELLIRAQYDKIDINGSAIFGQGTNNICIRKNAIAANNYPIVTVATSPC